jgi:hypothetical protein
MELLGSAEWNANKLHDELGDKQQAKINDTKQIQTLNEVPNTITAVDAKTSALHRNTFFSHTFYQTLARHIHYRA